MAKLKTMAKKAKKVSGTSTFSVKGNKKPR